MGIGDNDKTPLPSRNPMLKGESVATTTSVPDRRPPPPVVDEPKVEISDDLLADEEAFLLMDTPSRSARPNPRPAGGAAPRRPVRSTATESDDERNGGGSSRSFDDPAEERQDAEKTHIRPAPVPPRRR